MCSMLMCCKKEGGAERRCKKKNDDAICNRCGNKTVCMLGCRKGILFALAGNNEFLLCLGNKVMLQREDMLLDYGEIEK